MIRSLAVYCGSSAGNDPHWAELARATGTLLAKRGIRVVYGGGGVGMMGALADAALAAGGAVTGVIPHFLNTRELKHPGVSDMRVVATMHERKQLMVELAEFVDRVFYASNFVTVTKKEDVEWLEVQNTIKNHIKEFLESGKFIIDIPKAENVSTEEETEAVKKIKTILEEYIRPAVEQDGGAITYHSFKDGIVKVQLQGSCSGCPSSMVTLKAGIENLFTRMMPGEVLSVEALG